VAIIVQWSQSTDWDYETGALERNWEAKVRLRTVAKRDQVFPWSREA
jgi:hypothetical protein